ncbi:MAG: potassium channel family protein [Thermoproteota archaeon]|nr:potassium channel family protein [Thermoproteota archaeon]
MDKKLQEFWMLVLTGTSVLVILLQYIVSLTSEQIQLLYIFDLFVVGILAADFCNRARKEEEIWRFILKNLYEIPAMIPIVAFVPFGSQGAIGVVFRLLRMLRVIYLFRRTLSILEGRRFFYIIVFSSMAIIIGAACEYMVESPAQGTKIHNIGDAFWWAIVTVTTVGYGDIYPVTIPGRIIAAVLMFVGIAILGVLISTLGAALLESRLKKKGASMAFADQTKIFIKDKIDKLEHLDDRDFEILIATMRNIRDIKSSKNN